MLEAVVAEKERARGVVREFPCPSFMHVDENSEVRGTTWKERLHGPSGHDFIVRWSDKSCLDSEGSGTRLNTGYATLQRRYEYKLLGWCGDVVSCDIDGDY